MNLDILKVFCISLNKNIRYNLRILKTRKKKFTCGFNIYKHYFKVDDIQYKYNKT